MTEKSTPWPIPGASAFASQEEFDAWAKSIAGGKAVGIFNAPSPQEALEKMQENTKAIVSSALEAADERLKRDSGSIGSFAATAEAEKLQQETEQLIAKTAERTESEAVRAYERAQAALDGYNKAAPTSFGPHYDVGVGGNTYVQNEARMVYVPVIGFKRAGDFRTWEEFGVYAAGVFNAIESSPPVYVDGYISKYVRHEARPPEDTANQETGEPYLFRTPDFVSPAYSGPVWQRPQSPRNMHRDEPTWSPAPSSPRPRFPEIRYPAGPSSRPYVVNQMPDMYARDPRRLQEENQRSSQIWVAQLCMSGVPFDRWPGPAIKEAVENGFQGLDVVDQSSMPYWLVAALQSVPLVALPDFSASRERIAGMLSRNRQSPGFTLRYSNDTRLIVGFPSSENGAWLTLSATRNGVNQYLLFTGPNDLAQWLIDGVVSNA